LLERIFHLLPLIQSSTLQIKAVTENELSKIIIGESIILHKSLGPGLLESVYERCLVHRLIKANFFVEEQRPIPLIYDGIHLECGFRCDIVVEKKLIIEVKAVDVLNDIHRAQLITYLKLTGLKLGLLINFNVARLKDGLKRVVNNL
jgi:GxxExxY protein